MQAMAAPTSAPSSESPCRTGTGPRSESQPVELQLDVDLLVRVDTRSPGEHPVGRLRHQVDEGNDLCVGKAGWAVRRAIPMTPLLVMSPREHGLQASSDPASRARVPVRPDCQHWRTNSGRLRTPSTNPQPVLEQVPAPAGRLLQESQRSARTSSRDIVVGEARHLCETRTCRTALMAALRLPVGGSWGEGSRHPLRASDPWPAAPRTSGDRLAGTTSRSSAGVTGTVRERLRAERRCGDRGAGGRSGQFGRPFACRCRISSYWRSKKEVPGIGVRS